MKPDPDVFIVAAEAIASGQSSYVCTALSTAQHLGWKDCSSDAHRFFTEWFKPKRRPPDHIAHGWYGDPHYPESMCRHTQRAEARILALLLCIELLKTES